jgi:hypothetical protein
MAGKTGWRRNVRAPAYRRPERAVPVIRLREERTQVSCRAEDVRSRWM